MSDDASQYLIVPFEWQRGDPARLTLLLDQLCARPEWMQAPLDAHDRRATYAALLTNPSHGVFEVWRGGNLVGILTLHGITPGVEAVIHFVFFDANLVGRRSLLRTFILKCLRDYGFRRLVALVPEPAEKLLRFLRTHLGFRYEGEGLPIGTDVKAALLKAGITDPDVWAAKRGSRSDGAHFWKGTWVDLLRLRVTVADVKDWPMA